ncbi:MAG: flagellar biosynthetic protein FliO [Porticoccaceae bacterium]|nr:flagellar biosynthetic protein FliO [Porticoccaceae bacterium]
MNEIGLSEWLSMMGSLAVVLVLLGATLFGLKKMGLSTAKNSTKKMQVKEVHNLGPRQKLIVVSINNEEVLLGVTPQAINRLGTWPDQQSVAEEIQTPDSEQTTDQSADSSPGKFQQLIKQFSERNSPPSSEGKEN